MALETIIFQEDPFSYGGKDYCNMMALGDYYNPDQEALNKIIEQESNGCWDSPPSSMVHSLKEWKSIDNSSPEFCTGTDLIVEVFPAIVSPIDIPRRRKRRLTKSFKNKEEIESRRMTHISVERNRRRQMNHYLAVLRSLMPPSYAQRGDQASIVGGAINFVKELEQLLQFLESHKQVKHQAANYCDQSHVFNNFFTFPQYSTCPIRNKDSFPSNNGMAGKQSTIADIEVTMAESHANIKVLSSKRPKQLFKMVIGFHSMSLTILHLNITTVDDMVLYSFSVKVEEDCQLTTIHELSTAVNEILGMIQEEAIFLRAKTFP